MTLMVDGRPTKSSHRRLAWLDGFFWAMTRSSPHGREAQAKYTSVQLSICTGTRQSAQRNWPQTPSARTTPSILLSHLVGSQHSNQLCSTSLNLVYQQTQHSSRQLELASSLRLLLLQLLRQLRRPRPRPNMSCNTH